MVPGYANSSIEQNRSDNQIHTYMVTLLVPKVTVHFKVTVFLEVGLCLGVFTWKKQVVSASTKNTQKISADLKTNAKMETHLEDNLGVYLHDPTQSKFL